ncbi:SDR family NAD(P)-dependent oxidoreductase [Thalassospiraceae bacterium LMO-JJ14]|nr:SDR family NAD(P)-dependent oxidoreductase [Thalassospiraceae bacterium LMO-JJ14]
MPETLFKAGNTAVITGAALGIGRAAAHRFAALGMRVCMADLASEDFDAALDVVRKAAADPEHVMAVSADVADLGQMSKLRDTVTGRFGPVDVLMNNAVSRVGPGFWDDLNDWRRTVDVNLWGVIHGVRAFVPGMIESGRPGYVINMGSKQGITNPPGNTVYNLTKAAIKSFTESLQHELRNGDNPNVSAHLVIPGWTTTGHREHKPGAWLPEQVVDVMMPRIENGDFYIVCPDGEVTPGMDRARILWSAGDVTENRPALSRWHGGYGDAFKAFETD